MAEKTSVSDWEVMHPKYRCAKIPEKSRFVDVCGIPFEIKEGDSNSRADMSMGRRDAKMALNTLIKEMPDEVKDSTLIHEWLHSVLDCVGMGEYSGDEKLVCALQNELYRAGFRVKKLPM